MGHVACCEVTGYLTIRDSSGAIPVVCLLPDRDSTHTEPNSSHKDRNSAHSDILNAIGSTVLLHGLTIYQERWTTTSSLPSPQPVLYISPQHCTVITPPPALPSRQQDSGSSCLYFHVVSKNCVVITSKLGMVFNAVVRIDTSPRSFGRKVDQASDATSNGCSDRDKLVEVALCFSGEGFKWYSYVVNGGVYSISSSSHSLPSLAELSRSSYLQVTSDMELKLVGLCPLPQQVYDVTELVDKVPLPGFLKERETEKAQNTRYV